MAHDDVQYHSLGDEKLVRDPSDTGRVPLRKSFSRSVLAFLPSFVGPLFGYRPLDQDVIRIDDTTYLNGVRGLAAMAVCLQHLVAQYYPYLYWAPGARPEDNHLIQLPFIRLLLGGQFAVHVFFTLSGFVLSYGPLKKAYDGQYDRVLSSLPSSILRRPLRLMLPLWPIVVICCVLIEMGYFPATPMGSLTARLADGWSLYLYTAWAPFRFSRPGDADIPLIPNWAHAWTLSCESRGSMVVFMVCTQIRMAPWLRMLGVTAFSWACLAQGYYDISLFLAGMLLAELRHLRRKSTITLPPAVVQWMPFFWHALLIASLYVGSFPSMQSQDSPWYRFFFDWPTIGALPRTHYLNMAAVGLIASLENLPGIQRWLNSPVLLYLGNISFGLYLTHWPVVFSVGQISINNLLLRGWTPIWALLTGGTMVVVLSIWAGDVYCRHVDRNCVKFAAWVAKKTGV